jgi:hypothetical protein
MAVLMVQLLTWSSIAIPAVANRSLPRRKNVPEAEPKNNENCGASGANRPPKEANCSQKIKGSNKAKIERMRLISSWNLSQN